MVSFNALLAVAAVAISVLPVPCTPQEYAPERSNALWRRLLQAPGSPGVQTTSSTGDSVFLNLCETNLCESFRTGGVCDRWAKGSNCTRRDVFYVQGDPGENDKAEMFFNLRSPFDITCSMGRCTPDDGSQYDVFVAEGCIPEKDYVSEMQDVTSRTSKQVKIYLRRKAEYYISVERKDTAVSGGNCTYGMTAGSIESRTTSRCFDFRRLSETDVVKVPNCRDVMPVFTGAVLPDTSTQATFIIALVGVGVLSIALIVLAFILIKRFRKRMHAAEEKKAKNKQVDDLEKIGIQDSPSARAGAEITPTKDIIGTNGKKQRHKLTERMKGLEQEEADPDEEPEGMGDMDIPGGGARRFKQGEEGEYGSGAGVIEEVEPGVERLRKGVGGGRLVFQGSRGGSRASSRPGSGHGSSGSSGEQRGMQRTPSPADELLRSQLLSKQTIPHSPSSKRKGAGTPRGREALSSAGSMRSAKFEDLEEGMEFGSDVWASEAGVKIDDILEDARKAAQRTHVLPPGAGRGRGGLQHQVAASTRSPSVASHASKTSSSSGSGSSGNGKAIKMSPHPPSAVPAPPSSNGAGVAVRPQIAPLMAARLGLTTPSNGAPPDSMLGTGGMRVPPVPASDASGRRPAPIQLSSPPNQQRVDVPLQHSPPRPVMSTQQQADDAGWSIGGTTPSPPRDDLNSKMPPGHGRGRAVALAGIPPPPPKDMNLPRSGQPGVPPPPPRPSGIGGGRPAAMALATSGLAQRLGAFQGGHAPAPRADRSSSRASSVYSQEGGAHGSPPGGEGGAVNRAGVLGPKGGAGGGGVMSPSGSAHSSGSSGLGGGVSIGPSGATSKDGRGMATLGGGPGLGVGKNLPQRLPGSTLGRVPPPPPPRRESTEGGGPAPPAGSPVGRPTTSGGRPTTSSGRAAESIPPPPPRDQKPPD